MHRLAPFALVLVIASTLPARAQDAAAGDLERVAQPHRDAAARARTPADAAAHLLEGGAALSRRAGGSQLAATLFEEAIERSRAAGDVRGEVFALSWLSSCMEPGRHPQGSWKRAEEVARRAMDVATPSGDRTAKAEALHRLAFCLEPGRAEAGTWQDAGALYERAASIAGEEDPGRRGKALHQLSGCLVGALREGKGEANALTRARELLRDAARLRATANDRVGAAESLYNLGRLHQRDYDAQASTGAAAADIFRRAAEEYAAVGDFASEADALMGQGRCCSPQEYTDGDWSAAAPIFARAVAAAERAGDPSRLARMLFEQAWAEGQGGEQLTPAARRLLERSRELALTAGPQKVLARIDAWLAKAGAE